MGQSLAKLYVHLIFGTKRHYPFIKREWSGELYAYMAGALKNYHSPAIIINGASEHVHILFCLSKNHALAKVVEEVKKQSSKWVKQKSFNSKFTWQIGYAAFSVSSSKVEIVKTYIANQQAHHKKKTFREEVMEFMKKYNIIEFEEKFFFDE
ncbi:MAG: IS200/IS605 family transposase [Bacteroidales bacterium]